MRLIETEEDAEDIQHTRIKRAMAASRSTWISVVVNVILSGAQIAAGLLSKSQGLVADGIHSLSDLVSDFVVLFASHHSRKDADDEHPYGHHRFETAASLALGATKVGTWTGGIASPGIRLTQMQHAQ
jgi:cation diffusion facilitator family transporter